MGDIVGDFLAVAITMKSLPSGYNLDLQEITPKVWKTIECISNSLLMLISLLPLLRVSALSSNLLDFTTSTELANILTRKYKLPFRSAHRIVGAMVQELVREKRSLSDATPQLIESLSKRVLGISLKVDLDDIRSCVDPLKVVEAHKVRGGPSPEEIRRALKARSQTAATWTHTLTTESDRLREASDELQSLAEQYSALDRD